MKHTYFRWLKKRQNRRAMLVIAAAAMLSFGIGIKSAGDVAVTDITSADSGQVIEGDFDGNGMLDDRDIELGLELVRGFRNPTPAQLRVDLILDGKITLDDIMKLQKMISHR